MCGRYTIFTSLEKLAAYFDAEFIGDEFKARYNAAPGQNLPVVAQGNIGRIVMGHWGYPIHIQGKEKEIINIRSESVKEKPFFRRMLVSNRCLILADGFYEWKTERGVKTPYRIAFKDNRVFAFAGLFVVHKVAVAPYFAIITVPPSALMTKIHNRMPAILPRRKEKLWLDQKASQDSLFAMLAPLEDRELEVYPVSRLVNNPRNDAPKVIEGA